MSRRIFITVAEVSGDLHAAEFIRALISLDPSITIDAIGGPRMAEAGANVIYESVGNAAMSWRGALRAIEVLRLIRQTRRRYQTDAKPDLHVCIDSSAMNLPFAKMAHSMKVPVLYYIAPQLWASREGRIKQMRAYVDRVACILPFEEKFYRDHGVNATFVGHPLFDELPADRQRPAGERFPEAPPTIGIVPGSRKSEATANFPHLLDVADRIKQALPGSRFVVPTTDAVHSFIEQMLQDRFDSAHDGLVGRGDFELKRDAFDELISRCDLCLCKSGTSTLHVAAWGVPMIVVYRLNPILWNTLGRWLIKTRKIALVNILAGNIDLVPEFIPWHGSNEPVANLAIDWLKQPTKLNEARGKLLNLVNTLDKPGASMNAAKMAMEMMQEVGSMQ